MVLVAMAPGQFLGMFCRESQQDWVSSMGEASGVASAVCGLGRCMGGGFINVEHSAQEVREGRSGLSSVGHWVQFPWATFRLFEQACSWSQIQYICQGLVRNAEATLEVFST